MPKIFKYFGYLIYIYAHDHLPVHIHAKIQDREGKFILLYNNGILTIEDQNIKGKPHLTAKEVTEMRKFVRVYANKIKEQWETIHYYKKKVTCIEVKRRV
ncbi:MAG TPA: DUF4160 domain-containing protein [Chitinophagaceae bacterium]|nr:DUF4160 domain-containing protein [Chitinophagaceae bacterium]MCC6634574.1 DUF4160 domain-containing protein [Chitinophagaceae bacterium]HMZ46672.1 DUF4160 domain-containing protein [Chitinophagaceae bacterium]HNE93816.1 DUF4160 domain-containing protein [Chitinophagaceae bacterium]HNF30756.1 DUF4160 domain-containing protein [Chitinophagaceae bacterium]